MDKKTSYYKREPSEPVQPLTERERELLNCFRQLYVDWETREEQQWYCDYVMNKTYARWSGWWTEKRKMIESGTLRGFLGTMQQMDDYWDNLISAMIRAQRACEPFAVLDACDALKKATNEKHVAFEQQMKQKKRA